MKESTHLHSGLMLSLMLCLSVMLVSASAGDRPADRADEKSAYDTAVLDEAELSAELAAACRHARQLNRPLLLEFSAPWCSDCLVLHRMKQEEALSAELARWPRVVINVGDFEEHPELLDAFAIRSIARWVVLRPENCEAPIFEWPRITQRTIEPDTSEEREVSSVDLAKWLEGLRTP